MLYPAPPIFPHHQLATGANAYDIKTTPGFLSELTVENSNTSDVWIQIFNVPSASVTVGTTTPVLSFRCLAGDGIDASVSVPIAPGEGKYDFSNKYPDGTSPLGISYAVTTTRTGNTAPTLDVAVNAGYR